MFQANQIKSINKKSYFFLKMYYNAQLFSVTCYGCPDNLLAKKQKVGHQQKNS